MATIYSQDNGILIECPKVDTYLNSISIPTCKKIAVTGKAGSGKTHLALEYVYKHLNCYDRVFYVVFDKEKHLYYDKSSILSVDCILKRAIVRAIANTRGYLDGSELDFFEKCLGKNTLVVIDNYDIGAISPYMRHVASSDCHIILCSRCDIDCGEYGFEKICLDDDCIITLDRFNDICNNLSNDEKVLLMSLSAMQYYLCDNTEIISSDSGVFDRDSVKFYLGKLATGLDKLISFKLVRERTDGRIYVDRYVCEMVFSLLKPDADNCRTLMGFFEEATDFDLSQNVKNTFAKAYSEYEEILEIVFSDEFSELYTYFAFCDNDACKKLYNMLFVKVLDRLATNGENLYYHHLLSNNLPYYLELLYEKMSEDCLFEIYTSYDIETNDTAFGYRLSFLLDMVRLCVSLLRNMPTELYDANASIMKLLHKVMCEILDVTKESDIRMNAVEAVIKIGLETFSGFCVIDSKGSYNSFRDCFDTSIKYTCNSFADSESATGLCMGYSENTLSLYVIYYKYLEIWLSQKNTGDADEIMSLQYSELYESMNVHMGRIFTGFENFCDFFEVKWNIEKLFNETDIKKRLSDNKRFVLRGYDGGTKSGAKRYAEMIVSTVSRSKNPLSLVRIVLNQDYNVSDECYAYLLKMGFVKLVVDCEKISNLSKQNLALWLIDFYNEKVMTENRRKLMSELIAMLLHRITHTAAFEEKLCHVVSSMYFENKTCNPKINHGFADSLYERICIGNKYENLNGDDYIAFAVYNYLKYGTRQYDSDKLYCAFSSAVLSYLTNETDFHIYGFFNLCSDLCGYDKAYELYQNTNEYFYDDFSFEYIK
ncbi:MAG: hypothetical protein E7600_03930 [Ruminococcaceae bacterium]|nr:hypothetical protein [Oscillospiraceae bacterium]